MDYKNLTGCMYRIHFSSFINSTDNENKRRRQHARIKKYWLLQCHLQKCEKTQIDFRSSSKKQIYGEINRSNFLRTKTDWIKQKVSHYAIVRDAAAKIPDLLQTSPRTRLVGLAGIRVTVGWPRVLHAGIDVLQAVHQRFRYLAAVHLRTELVRSVHETLQSLSRRHFRRLRGVLDAVEQGRGANGRERSNGRTGQHSMCRRSRGRCPGAGGGRTLPTPRHVPHLCEKRIS